MVCPLELVANVSERLSRQAGVQQRVLGRWLRSGFAIVALYAVRAVSTTLRQPDSAFTVATPRW